MKWAITILVIGGVAGLFAAITGIQSGHYSSISGLVVTHHGAGGRILGLAIGFLFLTTAWGCVKRKQFGWYVVATLLWSSVAWSAFRAIYLTFTVDLPIAALALGALGEAVRVGIAWWLAFRFWPQQRKEFKQPNHFPEPPLRAVH